MQHRHKNSSIALALVSGISIFTGVAAPAHAVTLLDMLRGGPGASRPGKPVDNGLPGVGGNIGNNAMPSERSLADPEPLPKVSGPRYYTYKADAERAVKTATFAASTATDATRFIAQAKLNAPADIASALEEFYNKTPEPIWVSASDVNDKARGLLALFQRAGEYGLEPADYVISAPSLTTASVGTAADAATAAAATPDAHDKALMQFEMALSKKALMFAQDMTRGRIDPNRISGYHDFKRKDVKLSLILPLAKSGPDAAAFLEGMSPKGPQFVALKAELAQLRATTPASTPNITLPADFALKPGKSSPNMANVIAAIQHNGSDALKAKHAATFAAYQQTPDYTPELVEVVKSFQAEVGLKPDGVIGGSTVRKMVGQSSQDKIGKVIVAMEEARWLPDDLGQRYVLINQPAYTVYYHDKGAEQFNMRVVVGGKANQTFFFQDEIETVEFNPYWGVPQSIIINEMLPHLRKDPSYLDRMGYEVSVKGKAVPSSSVNWFASTESISVRQPPSSDNALGDLKILFPNAHAIYMHDTPSKSFFQRDMRALSHGCVRLADPRKMAAAVLGTSIDDVNKRIAGGKNEADKVPVKIPVYVAYMTAWPNKDGKIEYFDDVYGRDDATAKAFGITTKARASQI